MAKILLVEDDANLGRSLSSWLEAEKYSVEWVLKGTHAKERLETYSYDLVILDWELPEIEGWQICEQFRKSGGTTPIIMLTGKDASPDMVKGLDAGADDYLTKPFEISVLLARLRSLLRRPTDYAGSVIKLKNFELDTRTKAVTKDAKPIKLQPKEFAILEFLMRNPNKIFSTDELLKRVWTDSSVVSSESLYTYMKTLRKKLSEGDGICPVKTVHSQGYSFEA